MSLELDDIQAGALHERPSPYVGTYLLLRIDDRADGRELVRRLHRLVDPAGAAPIRRTTPRSPWPSPTTGCRRSACRRPRWTASPPSSGRGWRLAPTILGDTGESGPEHWEPPLGSSDVHVAIAVLSPDEERLRDVAEQARDAHEELAGVELIWRQDCYQLPTGRTSFGFKDGIGQPTVEGSGRPATNPKERPLKAGEIILGYPDESGELPPMPTPDVLGRNGTYVVFRKLHTKVAAYRQYLRDRAHQPRGRGPARREDGRSLAERRAARALARRGRPRARQRSAAQQRLRLRRRPARLQVSRRRARPPGEPARRLRRATAASTSASTG